MKTSGQELGRLFGTLLLYLLASSLSARNTVSCVPGSDVVDGYRIEALEVPKGWRGRIRNLKLPIDPSSTPEQPFFSVALLEEAADRIIIDLQRERIRKFRGDPAITVNLVDSCVTELTDNRVRVYLAPVGVRIPTVEAWFTLLERPIKRRPTSLQFNLGRRRFVSEPTFAAHYDEAYGFFLSGLLRSRAHFSPEVWSRGWVLRSTLKLRKAVDNVHSELWVGSRFLSPNRSKVPGLHLFVNASRNLMPFSAGTDRRTLAFRAGGGVDDSKASGLVRWLRVSANYKVSLNRLEVERLDEGSVLLGEFPPDAPLKSGTSFREQGIEFGTVGDLVLLHGVGRFGVWVETGQPQNHLGAEERSERYVRIASRFSMYQPIRAGKNEWIGLETGLMFGESWSVPSYRLFTGGTPIQEFLGAERDDPFLAVLPSGPELNFLGANRLIVESFAGASVKLTLPFPRWWVFPRLSRSLFMGIRRDPDLVTGETVRTHLRQVTAPLLMKQYLGRGFLPEDALKKVRRDLDGLSPFIDHLADRAKAFAVRPLLRFQSAFAPLGTDDFTPTLRIYGGGAGVQVLFPIGKVEVSYNVGRITARSRNTELGPALSTARASFSGLNFTASFLNFF